MRGDLMTYEEIALRLGISTAGARNATIRGLKKIARAQGLPKFVALVVARKTFQNLRYKGNGGVGTDASLYGL